MRDIRIIKVTGGWEGQVLGKNEDLGLSYVADSYRADSLNALLAAMNMIEGEGI